MSLEAQPEPSSGKTVRDAQELTNLRLTEEKLRQDLLDLRRPYLFRNPQLLTALITSVGALVAVSLLVQENYFKIREERNNLQAAKTAQLDREAADARKRAEVAVTKAAEEAADARKRAEVAV